MRPEPFEPKVANVVITASTMVGTASSWNNRVYTVATKLAVAFNQSNPNMPNIAPTTSAAIHIIVLFIMSSFSGAKIQSFSLSRNTNLAVFC